MNEDGKRIGGGREIKRKTEVRKERFGRRDRERRMKKRRKRMGGEWKTRKRDYEEDEGKERSTEKKRRREVEEEEGKKGIEEE